jgi:hypothetical protein
MDYRFAVLGGAKASEGKTLYPDYVIMKMDRQKAFEAIQNLVAQLKREDEDEISLYLLGEVKADTEA